MKQSPHLTAELARLVSMRGKRARIAITGASMEPSLRAGMVVDVEPLTERPRIGDILVFRSERALVAHRLTGVESLARGKRRATGTERRFDERIGRYVTSGDAHPRRSEKVPPHSVVGRVRAVWTSGEPDAERVDGRRFRLWGALLARTRGPRAILATLRASRGRLRAMLSRLRVDSVRKPVFATLVAATHAFERRDFARGVALLDSLERTGLFETARRHHLSGFLSNWLDAASDAGTAVPRDLSEAFRRMRWANAIQTGRVRACLHDVHDVLRGAGIAHIFLKGAGRLAARDTGAEVQFSADVDVLVPAESANLAQSALRAAGYTRVANQHRRSNDDPWHHHCEALMSSAVPVPVEVHFALAAPALVSQRLDYSALRPFARTVTNGSDAACVLDELGSAIVLAYHARDLHVWRDVVLLSRLLRGFDAATRRRFDEYMKAESTDGLRLGSAVAAAGAYSSEVESPPAAARYLGWALLREDLPRPSYCDIVEAVIGRCPMPKLHLHAPATLATWLRCWIRNLISLPAIARAWGSRDTPGAIPETTRRR